MSAENQSQAPQENPHVRTVNFADAVRGMRVLTPAIQKEVENKKCRQGDLYVCTLYQNLMDSPIWGYRNHGKMTHPDKAVIDTVDFDSGSGSRFNVIDSQNDFNTPYEKELYRFLARHYGAVYGITDIQSHSQKNMDSPVFLYDNGRSLYLNHSLKRSLYVGRTGLAVTATVPSAVNPEIRQNPMAMLTYASLLFSSQGVFSERASHPEALVQCLFNHRNQEAGVDFQESYPPILMVDLSGLQDRMRRDIILEKEGGVINRLLNNIDDAQGLLVETENKLKQERGKFIFKNRDFLEHLEREIEALKNTIRYLRELVDYLQKVERPEQIKNPLNILNAADRPKASIKIYFKDILEKE